MAIRTVEWRNGAVVLLDQRLLPTREVYRVYRDYHEVVDAIKDLVVRGAPAIGVTAAMGIALAVQQQREGELSRNFERICRTFAAARPTAINLFWAIERMRRTTLVIVRVLWRSSRKSCDRGDRHPTRTSPPTR
jgi:methylthioribose-1-phosphate isomerase